MYKMIVVLSFFALVGCNASSITVTPTHPIATVSAIPTRAIATATPSATVLKYAPGLHLTPTPIGTPDPRPISSQNIANLVPLVEFNRSGGEIRSIAWESSDNWFAIATYHKAMLYSANTLKLLNSFSHYGESGAVAINPSGSILATREFRLINLWDVQSGQLLRKLNTQVNVKHPPGSDGRYTAFSPDGKILAASVGDHSWDYAVILWDVDTGKVLHKLEKQIEVGQNTFFQPTFSPTGTSIAFGAYRGTILVWDVNTGKLAHQLEGHSLTVYNVVFSHDGQQLISGSWDGTIRVWDLTTGKETQKIDVDGGSRDGGGVFWIALTPDGTTLLARAAENSFAWDFQSGQLTNQTTIQKPFGGTMIFTTDGKRLITNTFEGVTIWGTSLETQPVPFQTAVASTRIAYPLKGSVRIQAGRQIGGIEGVPMDIPVEFEATSPHAPVTEMRIADKFETPDEMSFRQWEPYAPHKIFSYTPPGFNFFSFVVGVQFRDAKGNLSPIYVDTITVEGMPKQTP